MTVGIAKEYRLFVEFDWSLPVKTSSDELIRAMVAFLASSLSGMAEQETVTPSRRRAARKASKEVRELATC
ncbi:MAG: hypothetical protein ACRDNZ_13095 [Streptosporangiaceae bacterium]